MNRRLALKLLSTASAWAQRPGREAASTPAPPRAVMDVVVTGDGDRPVNDLAPADFAVYEGGQPRTVAAFAAIDALSGAVRGAAPLPLPMKIEPGGTHRTLVLVVDDAGISSARASTLRAALTRFVNEHLIARDTAALLRSSGGTGSLERLTSDHRLLESAVERVAFNPAAHPPSTPPWPETLRFALEGLRAMPGRKAVALFWERAPENYNFAPLIALANQAWSSVYPIHMGPQTAEPPAGMLRLAAETGGLSLALDASAALARVLQDQESYYLVGFAARSSQSPEVRSMRNGLTLRARAQWPAISPVASTDMELPAAELARIIANPLDSGSLRVDVVALFTYTTAYYVDVLLQVDGHDVAVTRKLNGVYEGSLDVLLNVCGMKGEVLYNRGGPQSLSLTEQEYRQFLDEGMNYAVRLPVAGPGVFEVRAAVLDATSSQRGVAQSLIEVPDVFSNRLVLSGIVLEPAATADSAARDTGPDSGRRRFHPGQPIAYRCSIYNASANLQNRAELEVRTTLYRGSRNVWEGAPIPLTTENAGQQVIRLRGNLELSVEGGSSEFVFQVTVTDKAAPGGTPRVASGWTSFRLR